MTTEQKIEKLTNALTRALSLARIADDWNLGTNGEVQIEGEWISCSSLCVEFKMVLEECKS